MEKESNIDLENSENKENAICFVIMPFGGYFDSYYENIYKPAIEDAGLEPVRADNFFRPSAIIKDIWDCTKKAELVLADLTTKNPNVFYELGLAHAIQKPAVLVSQTVDDIPFDLRHLRYIEYNLNQHNWGDLLKGNITEAIKETLEKPEDAVLSYFFDVKEVETREVTETEKELLELKQEVDFIKKEITEMPLRMLEPEISLSRLSGSPYESIRTSKNFKPFDDYKKALSSAVTIEELDGIQNKIARTAILTHSQKKMLSFIFKKKKLELERE